MYIKGKHSAVSSFSSCSLLRKDLKRRSVKKICIEKINGKEGGYGIGVATLGRGHIIIIEQNDQSVFIFDTVKLNIVSRTKLESPPNDITTLNSRKDFAVSVTKYIHFFCVSNHKTVIKEQRAIKVNGHCSGLDYSHEKLFVSYPWEKPPKIEIMSLQGDVLTCISTSKNEKPLFQRPRYLAVYNDFIYVSDDEANAVLKLTQQGNVVNTYTDKDLKGPWGICPTGDGYFLVCGTSSYNIHLITADCKKMGLVLKPFEENVCWPRSLCFSPDNINVLYVVCASEVAVGYKILFTEP